MWSPVPSSSMASRSVSLFHNSTPGMHTHGSARVSSSSRMFSLTSVTEHHLPDDAGASSSENWESGLGNSTEAGYPDIKPSGVSVDDRKHGMAVIPDWGGAIESHSSDKGCHSKQMGDFVGSLRQLQLSRVGTLWSLWTSSSYVQHIGSSLPGQRRARRLLSGPRPALCHC